MVVILFVFAVISYMGWAHSSALFSAIEEGNHSQPPKSKTLVTPEHLPMEYGSTARPPFKDIIHDAALPEQYLPKLSGDKDADKHKGKRLIFIGDVHGMLGPLKELLAKITFDPAAGDHVVFAGDMITKGPDSVGVVEYAMNISASSVRGNHEDRILLAAKHLDLDRRRRKHHEEKSKSKSEDDEDAKMEEEPLTHGDNDQHPLIDPMEEEHFSRGNSKDRHLAGQLSTPQLNWLASLPVILKIGHIPPLGDVVAVHAGLVPGIPLEKQDPWAVMNMRSLLYVGDDVRVELARIAVEEARRAEEPDYVQKLQINVEPSDQAVQGLAMRDRKAWDKDIVVPIASRNGARWAKVWDKDMEDLAKKLDAMKRDDELEGEDFDLELDGDEEVAPDGKKRKKKHWEERLTSVVFGHDSKRGLQLGKYTYGIDTGCVRGGELTALIMEANASGKRVHTRLESVGCKSAGRAAENEDDF